MAKETKEDKMCESCGKMMCECGSDTMYEAAKWMQGAVKHPGALHAALGIAKDKKIPKATLLKKKAELHKKSEGDKKLSAEDAKLLKRVMFALNAKDLHEAKLELAAEIGILQEKSPPGMEKEVEKKKEALEKKGMSKEKAANIAFGSAWNAYKHVHKED